MKLRVYKDPMYTIKPLNMFSVRKITINYDWDTKILHNPFLREFHMDPLKAKVVP